ncbi:MAG TPA: threonine ammonia-lyase [Oligoflexia bacterium]|mgnify:CR=1 FL=1|nr:threonine ammonia-lyase [Oligoflexia bacterium]HMR24407.1 threonine ammonia-lyase [Oligoflexia bacterium]
MLKLHDIQAAQERIAGKILRTPIMRTQHPNIEHEKIFLKMESFHRTSSFKERGALNTILQLDHDQNKIVATSAGNHSQAVSYHGTKSGFDVKICMPTYTPLTKILATESWGAKVHLEGETFSDAMVVGKQMAEDEGAHFVHAFDDLRVMAGQGTVGLELLTQLPELELVVVPVGGGGLASGLAVAIKENNPNIKVIGVQAANCDLVAQLVKGVPEQDIVRSHKSTIGDGIAIKTIGQYTIPLMQKYLDDIVTVTEEEMAEAMVYLLHTSKVLLEGAGAAAFGAIMANKVKTNGHKTVAIASGGNVDLTLLSKVIQKSLVKRGRQASIELMISDRPGGLNELTSIIAHLGASILQIHHERSAIDVPFYETSVKLKLETKGPEHLQEILAGLKEKGYAIR